MVKIGGFMKISINSNTPLTTYNGIITSECFITFDTFYHFPCYHWVDSTSIVLGMWFSDYFRYIEKKEPCKWYFYEGDYHLLIQPIENDKYCIKCVKDSKEKYITYLRKEDIIISLDNAITDFIYVLIKSNINAEKTIQNLNVMHNIIVFYLKLSKNEYMSDAYQKHRNQ